MDLDLLGQRARLYTGGRAFDRRLPTVVLVHGAGHDHSVWNHQARHLAHHGFSVLAPDLPGHGASTGQPLHTIEALADWLAAALDAVDVERATLAGHSMGSLIALEAAARHPARSAALALIGSAAPMPVTPVLLQAAETDRPKAHGIINQWSYTPASHLGASPVPGLWLPGVNAQLMARQHAGVLAAGLAACNAYQNGQRAAAKIRCPTLLIQGERDQMTPERAARPLREAFTSVPGGIRVVTLPATGHALMAEAPDAVTGALRGFLAAQ